MGQKGQKGQPRSSPPPETSTQGAPRSTSSSRGSCSTSSSRSTTLTTWPTRPRSLRTSRWPGRTGRKGGVRREPVRTRYGSHIHRPRRRDRERLGGRVLSEGAVRGQLRLNIMGLNTRPPESEQNGEPKTGETLLFL